MCTRQHCRTHAITILYLGTHLSLYPRYHTHTQTRRRAQPTFYYCKFVHCARNYLTSSAHSSPVKRPISSVGAKGLYITELVFAYIRRGSRREKFCFPQIGRPLAMATISTGFISRYQPVDIVAMAFPCLAVYH